MPAGSGTDAGTILKPDAKKETVVLVRMLECPKFFGRRKTKFLTEMRQLEPLTWRIQQIAHYYL